MPLNLLRLFISVKYSKLLNNFNIDPPQQPSYDLTIVDRRIINESILALQLAYDLLAPLVSSGAVKDRTGVYGIYLVLEKLKDEQKKELLK